MITVITQMFNEEDYLPFWLNHHKYLFDHGVMINANSNDRSVEIIHEICPTWEIVTVPTETTTLELDLKSSEIERSVSGWKICLNITEFIVRAELRAYIKSLSPQLRGVRTTGYVIQETPEERTRGLDNSNLLLQRTHGHQELKSLQPIPGFNPLRHRSIPERNRLLHRDATSEFSMIGRHTSHKDQYCPIDPNLPLAWFGCGIPEFKKRKNHSLRDYFNNVTYTIDGWHVQYWNGFAHSHLWTDEQIEQHTEEEQKITEDLTNDPDYQRQLNLIRHRDRLQALARKTQS